MTQFWLIPFRELSRFLIWWIWLIPKRIISLTKEWILDMDEVLVIGATIRLWFAVEPLFGDYDWKGRIIGFLFRFVRIVISLGVYLSILALGIAILLVWLALPILIVMSIFNLW